MDQKNKNQTTALLSPTPYISNNSKAITHKWSHLGRSFLNSMIGEYLEQENNPLAIRMGFYHHYKRLTLDASLPRQLNFPISNKVVVFVHGLSDTETIWDYPDISSPSNNVIDDYIDASLNTSIGMSKENYGRKLHQQFGYTPLFIRYNTGLSPERNGREFYVQLNKLFNNYPMQIDELTLIGFNMGGLLIKNAQSVARMADAAWLKVLSKCIYLGEARNFSTAERAAYYSREIMKQFWGDQFGHTLNRIAHGSHVLDNLGRAVHRLYPSKSSRLIPRHFNDSARHYFVHSGLNRSASSDYQKQLSLTAPAHSQNAWFEDLPERPLAHSDKVYTHMAEWVKQDEKRYDSHRSAHKSRLVLRHPVAANEEEQPTSKKTESTNQALLAGTVDFIASTYDKALENVETWHYSIAEEPFYQMQKLPIASQLAQPFEKAHRKVLNFGYRTLRRGGKLVHRTAKKIAPSEALTQTTQEISA